MNQINIFDTDILIIGGGIAGCIAATSLADSYKVTLIDKLITPKDKIGESLAPASQRIFKELGLFEKKQSLDDSLYLKSLGMQSFWGSDKVHFVDHMRNPDGFVRNINRKAFETNLREIVSKKDVHCLWGLQLYSSNYEDNKWNIIVKTNNKKNRTTQHIQAKLVIDATGRQAHFAKSIGIKRTAFDNLMACWFTIPDNNENKMSTIIADELGWWYTSVTPNNKRIISFQTDADLVDKNIFKHKDEFLKFCERQQIIKNLIIKQKDKIDFKGTVSANSTKLNQVAGKQWFAIGDAAISFDPLSSQGMFNAMANAVQVQKLLFEFNYLKEINASTITKFNSVYTNQVNNVWTHYLKHKKLFYNAETRWKETPFWIRRQ